MTLTIPLWLVWVVGILVGMVFVASLAWIIFLGITFHRILRKKR